LRYAARTHRVLSKLSRILLWRFFHLFLAWTAYVLPPLAGLGHGTKTKWSIGVAGTPHETANGRVGVSARGQRGAYFVLRVGKGDIGSIRRFSDRRKGKNEFYFQAISAYFRVFQDKF
jgi:hypothetical protein